MKFNKSVFLWVMSILLFCFLQGVYAQKLTHDGIGSWEYTNLEWQSMGPAGLLVDRLGLIQICDRSSHKQGGKCTIKTFTTSGKLLRAWGDFAAPAGIAQDSSGNFYVADEWRAKIYQYSPKYKLIKSWGGKEIFGSISGIAVDGNDNIFIVDRTKNRLQKFNRDGKLIFSIGKKGVKSGQFDSPQGIAIDRHRNVYIVDGKNKRVQMFNNSGKCIRVWPIIADEVLGGTAIAVGPDDLIYVGSLSRPISRVSTYRKTGQKIGGFVCAAPYTNNPEAGSMPYEGIPSSFSFDKNHNIYVLDMMRWRVMVFKPKKF